MMFLGIGTHLVLLFLGSLLWASPQTALSAQTGDPPDAAAEDAFAKAGCAGCHTIPGVANAVGQVGPDLSTIGSEAGTRKEGMDADAYLHESIVDPQAFIAPQCPNGDCPENVMLPNIAERLTDDEIGSIVDYLIALTGDGVADVPVFELVPIEVVRPAETETEPFAEPPKTYDDAQVLIGKYLFFDPRLSGDATQSCASCHQPELAYTDGEALNRGYTGTGYFRNAPTVMNTVFNDGYLYWDGRLDALDMPTTVRDHITFRRFFRQLGVPNYRALTADAGLFAVTKDADDFGAFRTAPLREVAQTAPYMHNGTFATLAEVVAFYNEGGGDHPNKDERLQPLELTADEQTKLVVFLESLCGDKITYDAPELSEYAPWDMEAVAAGGN